MYIFKCAVVGAGAMGGEIAQVISWSGLPVLLKDVDQAALDRGMATARSVYQRRVDKGKLAAAEMEEKLSLITPTLTYDRFADVDFVIEAVPEKLDLKQAVFRELDGVCQSTAILATNTSALSIAAIASRSASLSSGFEGVSIQIIRVLGRIAASNAARFAGSA